MTRSPENRGWSAQWVSDNTGRQLTTEQARCVSVLRSVEQVYNLPLIGRGWHDAEDYKPNRHNDDDPPILPPVEFGATWMIVRFHAPLATYDFANLTRLVLAAHEHAVRVEIRAEIYTAVDRDSFLERWDAVASQYVETREHPSYSMPCLTIQLNARQREGSMYERHPTIEQAIDPTLEAAS